MTAIFYYLIKVIICSGVLFGYYHLALRNKLFHQWNRFYLLCSVLLSLTAPFLRLHLLTAPAAQAQPATILRVMQSADGFLEEITIRQKPFFTANEGIALLYTAVSAFLLMQLIMFFARLIRLLRREAVQRLRSIYFVNTDAAGTPFSFFRYIFWNRSIDMSSETGQQIFKHELVHVEERHSFDKLFMQLILMAFWCNPFFWLMRNELRMIHEFIADKKAVGHEGATALAAMILKAQYPQHYHSLTNPFFQTKIKRRLRMLANIQHPKKAYLVRLMVLPLVALLIMAFTIKAKKSQPVPANARLEKTITVMKHDTIPSPKAKQVAFIDLRKQKQVTITYTDSTSEVLTTKEAMDRGFVNNNMFTEKIGVYRPVPKPLLILDGKEIDEARLNTINPAIIESVNVLKGSSAESVYGQKGKNGAVLIKTKTAKNNEPTIFLDNDSAIMKAQLNSFHIGNDNRVELNAANITTIKYSPTPAMPDTNIVGDVSGVVNPDELNREKPDQPKLTDVKVEIHYKSGADTIPEKGAQLSKSIFTKPEVEASVDTKEWASFLSKNLQSVVEDAGRIGVKPGQYTVYVRFLVKIDGSTANYIITKDPGHGFGKKVLEMMKASSLKWKPALQNGNPVNSYHTQPITFAIADQ